MAPVSWRFPLLARRPSRPAGAAAAVAVIALALAAACASGPVTTPPIRAGTPADPRVVNVILEDYSFVPTPIDLVPGETVRFNIIDGGTLPHEFVLGPQDWQDEWEAADAAATPASGGLQQPDLAAVSVPPVAGGIRVYLQSGQLASVTYTVPSGAPPLLECHIPGHLEKGMVGGIRFVPPAAAASVPPEPTPAS